MMHVMMGPHLDGVYTSFAHDGEDRSIAREQNVRTLEVTGWTHAAYKVFDKRHGITKLYELEYDEPAEARIVTGPMKAHGAFKIIQVYSDEDARRRWKELKVELAATT